MCRRFTCVRGSRDYLYFKDCIKDVILRFQQTWDLPKKVDETNPVYMNSDIEIYWKYCVRHVPWGFPRCPRKGTGGQASDGPPGSRHAPGGPRFTHAIFGGARAYASARLNDFNAERGKRWCGRRHGLTSARNRANQPPGVGRTRTKKPWKSKEQRERRDG